jgi:hypothetical protein
MSIQSAGRLGSWAYSGHCPLAPASASLILFDIGIGVTLLCPLSHTEAASISCMSFKFNLASFALSFAAGRCCYRVTHFENSVLIARGLSSQGRVTRIFGYADEVRKERTMVDRECRYRWPFSINTMGQPRHDTEKHGPDTIRPG